MRRFVSLSAALSVLAATLLLTACSGSGGTTLPAVTHESTASSVRSAPGPSSPFDPIESASAERSTKSNGIRTIGLKCNHGPPLHGPCIESVPIPASGAYSGTLSLPSGTGTLAISTSISALTFASGIQATPRLEITLTAKSAVVLNGRPAFAISVPEALGGSVSLAQNNPWTKIAGPVAVTNTGVSFAAAPGRITIARGKSVTFALYGGIIFPVVSGTVVDDTTGQPIVGATVIVSEDTVIAGATPPPASATKWPVATTAADGSFVVKNVAPSSWTEDLTYAGAGLPIYQNAQWLEVFSPDGHAAYHGIWSIGSSGTTNVAISIAMPSALDLAWLTQINLDRATVGVPAVASPLAFDSVTLQAARYWAQQMASYGFYSHQCPSADSSCQGSWLWQTQHHSLPDSQNIDYGYTGWTDLNAESAFMAEITNCPSGNWQTCPFGETTGHYMNIMGATFWVGVGASIGKDPTTQTGSTDAYYVENFTGPQNGISTIQSLRRSMTIHGPRNGGIGS